ncbi:hypothetical protein [Georgenia soli]|uniref:hypothetical protein n=1 Tax=Georgenia soli TaxID=638953 RepID=UPI003CCBEB32
MLLCASRDEQVVRYALASASAPLAVATCDTLPPEQRQDPPDREGTDSHPYRRPRRHVARTCG